MNSGIIRAESFDDEYHFHGSSGSVYICHKKCYGANMYGQGVIQQYIDHHGSLVVQMLPEDTDWVNFDWIIKS